MFAYSCNHYYLIIILYLTVVFGLGYFKEHVYPIQHFRLQPLQKYTHTLTHLYTRMHINLRQRCIHGTYA